MPKNTLSLVIGIDPGESTIHFYSMTPGDDSSLTHDSKSYKAKGLDEEFFKIFSGIVEEYLNSHPTYQTAAISVVLPDYLVATDAVSIPTINRRKMDAALDVTVESLYKNSKELHINRYLAAQNRQYTTFALSVIQEKFLASVRSSCAACKIAPQSITFAASSTSNAVQVLSPKYKGASFLFLDIKQETSRFVFVSKGRATGYYSLPFGKNIFKDSRVASEDMLFDHSTAELVVLNAKEKAKAKQLTMMQEDNSMQIAEDMSEELEAEDEGLDMTVEETPEDEYDNPTVQTGGDAQQYKTLPKKTARKLPKFMLRPAPKNEEEYVYENFRLFVKWALNLIQSNDKLTLQGAPEAVLVNLTQKYDYLFDMVNEEQEENGIPFVRFDLHDNDSARKNLELYGGFFTSQFNKSNNF